MYKLVICCHWLRIGYAFFAVDDFDQSPFGPGKLKSQQNQASDAFLNERRPQSLVKIGKRIVMKDKE